MVEPVELLLYTKPECGLCDEMKEAVEKVSETIAIDLKEVDITGDPKLEELYRLDIPLLFHNDRCLAKHKVHEKVLLKKLEKIFGK